MHQIFNQWKSNLVPVEIQNELDHKGKKQVENFAWVGGKPLNKNSIALLTGKRSVNVIDVDTKEIEELEEPFKSWCDDRLLFEDTLIVESKNGYHFYFYSDEFIKTTTNISPYIDIRGEGGVIFIHSDSKVANYDVISDSEPTEDVAEIIEFIPKSTDRENRGKGYSELDDFQREMYLAERPSREDIEEWLSKINPNCDYQTWADIIRALNSWDLDGEEGLELAINWSKRSKDHDMTDEDIKIKYHDNIADSPKFYNKLIGVANKSDKKHFEKEITNLESNEDFEHLAEELRESTLNNEDRDTLAQKIAVKEQELGLVNRKRAVHWKNELKKPSHEVELEIEDWISNIIYVDSYAGNKFYLLDTSERLSLDGVNGRYYNKLEEYRKQYRLKTCSMKTLLSKDMIRICSTHEYNPTRDDVVFRNKAGGLTLNLFKANSIPKEADEFTEEGLKLINALVEHLNYLMSADEASILLDWLAYSAQNLGKKILWTPLIQSVEGLGKSVIGNVMINHVFGTANAGTVDSNVVVSPQTSWATTGVFKVLEEIKLAGHNRYEVLNQLKPFITNHTVSRVEKYEASVEVRNFVNFIAFTNFKDAIPVTTDDRRWWIVYSKLNSINSLEELSGKNRFDYFEPLHQLARPDSIYGKEFKKFLLERDVSNFNPNFPPESLHKARMIATEDSKTANLSEVQQLLEHGGKGFNEEVVSTKQLKRAMSYKIWDGSVLSDGDITILLRKLNYVKFPKRMKSNGELHHIWFSDSGLSDDDLRDKFHESMKLEDLTMFEDEEEQ